METMKKYPKLRCPVCGMCVWLRNLVGFHKLTSWIVTFGYGRGKIHYAEQDMPEGLVDYWIRRLEEVISYLKSLKEKSSKLRTQQFPSKLEIRQLEKPMLDLPVLGKSVSMRTDFLSKSQKTQTQGVPRKSLTLSFEGTPELDLSCPRNQSLKIKRKL